MLALVDQIDRQQEIMEAAHPDERGYAAQVRQGHEAQQPGQMPVQSLLVKGQRIAVRLLAHLVDAPQDEASHRVGDQRRHLLFLRQPAAEVQREQVEVQARRLLVPKQVFPRERPARRSGAMCQHRVQPVFGGITVDLGQLLP